MRKPKVAFICVHNSCRSQIAEALGKKFASDVFDSYSAGTQIKDQINQDAVRLMKDIYNIDMEKTQHSKLISDLLDIDISITMGCDVICPIVENQYTEDWNLEDPTDQYDDFFRKIISKIEKNIKDLSLRIKKNEISLNEK
ncbi:arsenate reductase ArsC [uncultured Anaerococcus sp.]|uniref:arsenate reductase ArsC n=1 Tax=uncultured Anaerococcus sp. TaxID=293428 RepID=UPI0025DE12BF|nr:arsenate reductase ArsC [uncultured Anaerococcus sp.]